MAAEVQYEAYPVPVTGTIKIPVAVLDVPEGTTLFLSWAPFPGVPNLYAVALTAADAGVATPVACTRVGDSDVTVLVGIPVPAAFPAPDMEIFQVLQNVPGVALALLMIVPADPPPEPEA